MNHYSARQLNDGSGLWHYTCLNNDQVRAVGYCSPFKKCPECANNYCGCDRCNGASVVLSESPCPGHATAEEARKHYKEYVLDKLRLTPKGEKWPKHKCDVETCDCEGVCVASMSDYRYELCEAHANKETIATLFDIGESWSS